MTTFATTSRFAHLFRTLRLTSLAFLATAATSACATEELSADDAALSVRSGITPCGSRDCQAGQYCDEPGYQNACKEGCLSNNNCAADQTCIKDAGEDIGSCQNTVTTPPSMASEPDDPPVTSCTRDSFFDLMCLDFGLPSEAYFCGPGEDPGDSCVPAAPDVQCCAE